jgi:enoyl-CoA hydratase/carnithine racemase
MTDAPDKHICFIHAKLGAAPGWGAASRLVSIVGKKLAEQENLTYSITSSLHDWK